MNHYFVTLLTRVRAEKPIVWRRLYGSVGQNAALCSQHLQVSHETTNVQAPGKTDAAASSL